MTTDLHEKTILVTGATSGIGLAAAEQLVHSGATVIGIGRSPERCRQVEAYLRQCAGAGKVVYFVADLALQSQVRKIAAEVSEWIAQHGTGCLDGLINNAGGFSYWLTLTAEGFELQWAVNHLAPFLMTHELMSLLKASAAARVVTVSSGSHYHTRLNWEDIQLLRRYNGLRAYQQTKLANVLFSLELNRRLGADSTVRAFAADPGLVNTEIGMKDTSPLARWVWNIRRRGGKTPQYAAEGLVFLVGQPSIQHAQEIYWKHSQPKAPSRHALDLAAASRLWQISEQMCAISSSDYGLAAVSESPINAGFSGGSFDSQTAN